MPISGFTAGAQILKQRAKGYPVKVLVFGPGEPASDATPEQRKGYEKRCQIREEVSKEFPMAEVHFPEDPEMITIADGIRGQLRKEALQAKLSDIVIILDISRGADLEIDHFISKYSWVRDKVHIFLKEEYFKAYKEEKSLVAEVLKQINPNQIESFTDEDFKLCRIATEMAPLAVLSAVYDCIMNS